MTDEYLNGIMNREPESAPKREWQASFCGLPIHTDPTLPRGTVEFRDRAGKVIGTLIDVGGIAIGVQSS